MTPTFPWLGLLGVLPLPAKFYVRFGKPIRLRKGSSARAGDYITVTALSDLVRNRIQHEVDDLRARRGPIFGP